MSDTQTEHNGTPEPGAPQELVDDLAALCDADLTVPPEVDRAIVTMARERFAWRHRPRLVLRWAPLGAAAAAAVCILILMSVWRPATRERTFRKPMVAAQVAEREDVDGDGQVDILDAFALARHVVSDGEPKPEWDMNGDGAVDGRDVDIIARAAVSLERSTVQ